MLTEQEFGIVSKAMITESIQFKKWLTCLDEITNARASQYWL